MRYRAKIAKHWKAHQTYIAKKKRQIPKNLVASGLAPHLIELLEKHKSRAKTQADAAQRKTPLKDESNSLVQKHQGDTLKEGTDRKFKKTTIFALYGRWGDLVGGKILVEGVGAICPPAKPYSENFIFWPIYRQ